MKNTELLECQTSDFKVPCPPLSMMLIAFNTSHTLNTKGHSGSEKTYSNFIQHFNFPNEPIWIKVICNDFTICQLNKPYPNLNESQKNKILKDKVFILITEYHLTRKDQFHHPQKETHI